MTTAISAPVFCLSSSRSAVRRPRVAGGMTPARSVTKPSGAGMRGSAARAGSARARRSPPASPLRIERIDRLHDALDLAQVSAEVGPQGGGRKARLTAAKGEELPDGGQRPHDALPGGEDCGVAVPAVRLPETEQMAQHDDEALRRL